MEASHSLQIVGLLNSFYNFQVREIQYPYEIHLTSWAKKYHKSVLLLIYVHIVDLTRRLPLIAWQTSLWIVF